MAVGWTGRILIAGALVIVLFIGVFGLLLSLVDWYVPVPCNINTDFCLELKGIVGGRAALLANLGSISLSFIGTIAIVLTIMFSAASTDAAVKASRSAAETVNIARKTAEIELRPYISLQRIDLVNIVRNAQEGAMCVHVRWVNTGVSAARNVKTLANHLLTDLSPLPADFDFPDREGRTEAFPLGGNASIFSPTNEIGREDFERLLEDRARLFVWAWVEYQGPFSDQVYRTELNVEIYAWSFPEFGYEYRYRDGFNGIDASSHRPPLQLAPILG